MTLEKFQMPCALEYKDLFFYKRIFLFRKFAFYKNSLLRIIFLIKIEK